MTPLVTTVETVLAEIASRQHGVVTRTQLLGAGVTTHEIRHRLETGALLRVHLGVYRVGHRAPSLEACYLAAVIACGDGALLSGRSAAHLFGLLKGHAPPPQVTTVPRTLIDLAADLPLDDLARACHEAGVRYRTTPAQVAIALTRRPANTPGAPKLQQVISGDIRVTLSALERRFLDVLRAHALPLPQTNRPAGGHHVDCRWPEHRLTVELDSYRFHHSRHAWEQDRRRERAAHARGDDLRRYTWGEVFEAPRPMLAELRGLLA